MSFMTNHGCLYYAVSSGDFSSNGTMDWAGANAWVHYLDVTDYGGSNQWALPTTTDSSSSIGYPDGASGDPTQSSSQMAELFYGDLGQEATFSIAATHDASYSLFSNLESAVYWSGGEYSAEPSSAWAFNTSNGFQAAYARSYHFYALAVSLGDVSAVPEPGAAWLLGVGLVSLVGLGSGRRRAQSLALR